MAPRLPSLDGTVRTLILGEAPGGGRDRPLEAFPLARRLGVDGIDGTVQLTADGVPVLTRAARVGPRLRRRAVSSLELADVPRNVPSLAAVYERLDPTVAPALVDLPGPTAFAPVVSTARAAGGATAERRLRLGSTDLDALADWRNRTSAHLVHSTRLDGLDETVERRAARLRERGIDGLCLPHGDWTSGLIAMLHRFDRYAIGRGAVHERELISVVDAGTDAVSSIDADRLVAVTDRFYPER